jgi:hypothetical protein
LERGSRLETKQSYTRHPMHEKATFSLHVAEGVPSWRHFRSGSS